MANELDSKFHLIDTQFDGLRQTNEKILDVLKFIKGELSEIQEQLAFFAETAVTKTEFEQALAKMATKEELNRFATKADLLHFSDRFDAKFADLRQDLVIAIRGSDKKFLKFAL